MKILPKYIIIAISCFCAIDLLFIQSDFFLSCDQPRNYSMLHPICENQVSITFLFSVAASISIAAIVGISAFYSPKKSVIIVLVLTGLYLSNIVLYQVYTLSLDVTLTTNSRVMRPMTNTEMIMHNIVRSPLWLVVPSTVIISSITWGMIVLRKNIGKIL